MSQYKPIMSDLEFSGLIASKPFAKGTARIAFGVPSDPDVIVKKAIKPFPASNFLEWFVSQSAEATGGKLQQVLGVCIAISESGLYLMMERLDDITAGDYADVPDVPVWFDDPKPSAFGKRNGLIKIRDYGLVKMGQFVVPALTHPPAFAVTARTTRLSGR